MKQKINYLEIKLCVLGFFPLMYLFFFLTFYIHAILISGYVNWSAINPNEFPFYNAYEFGLVYGLFSSLILFAFLIVLTVIYLIKNRDEIILKPLVITTFLYLVVLALVLSKSTEFTMD